MMVKMPMKNISCRFQRNSALAISCSPVAIIVTVCIVDLIITDTIKITRIANLWEYNKNNWSKIWEVQEGIMGKIFSILGLALISF